MTILAGKYILRNFTCEDALPYYKIAHDEAVAKYVGNAYPFNLDEALELVETYSELMGNGKDFYFAITNKDKKIIGVIIAVQPINGSLDVSAFVAKEYRRTGIMTTSMKAFISWLRHKHPEITTLHFLVKKENLPSNMQLRKIGAVLQKFESFCTNSYVIYL